MWLVNHNGVTGIFTNGDVTTVVTYLCDPETLRDGDRIIFGNDMIYTHCVSGDSSSYSLA